MIGMLRGTRILHIHKIADYAERYKDLAHRRLLIADYAWYADRYKDLARLSMESFNFRLSVLKQPFRREVEQV